MSGFFDIEQNIEYIKKGSLVGLIIVVIILFGTYYDFFKYVELQINNTIIFLSWIYLFLNIGIASMVKYVNERNLPECPKCKGKLGIHNYKCKKCGVLDFNKK